MKIELISAMQIIFVLLFFVGFITYTITSIKDSLKKFNYYITKRFYNKSLDYSRFMIIKNYISYEKYDIWRYCVHF